MASSARAEDQTTPSSSTPQTNSVSVEQEGKKTQCIVVRIKKQKQVVDKGEIIFVWELA
jgi:hypothetical protein